ncbi:MAG TPA: GxxExxY protein [Chryseolinea sp.]|nr:GxxExxY protein [Chryseolinea sp.]
MINEQITDRIIAAALRIHSALGPGLLESAYREFLFYELELDGWSVEKEKSLPVVYKGKRVDHGYRLDLLVQNTVVVELKTVELLLRIHHQQLLTYLRLGNFKTGLLINFHAAHLKDGLKRISN